MIRNFSQLACVLLLQRINIYPAAGQYHPDNSWCFQNDNRYRWLHPS
ncbi:MAG: hypothetical protein ACI9UT_002965 [Flavobacteriales bacterium]